VIRWFAIAVFVSAVVGGQTVPNLRSAGPVDTATTTVSGFVFVDYDRDGIADPGERSDSIVGGITVDIVDGDGTEIRLETGIDGAFQVGLSGLPGLEARIAFDTPQGYQPSFAQQFGVTRPEGRTAVQFVDTSTPRSDVIFGIVPDSSCPVDPSGVGGPSASSPDGNPNSVAGKLWTTCFVDGARGAGAGARDVLVAANYDATGWDAGTGEFGGHVDVEHLGTQTQLGSIWGVAYDEWDGVLYTSAVVKRHSSLGPEGVDGLYWFAVGEDRTDLSATPIGLDSLSPPDAPSFGDDPSNCPVDGAGTGYDYGSFSATASGLGGVWDCRDLGFSLGAADGLDGDDGHNYDWWAFDRTGRYGIGDIDTTPDGNRLLVMNATADTLFVYDITSTRPVYQQHFEVADPGCRGGKLEAWATTALDSEAALIGVTCTASESEETGDLTSHIVRLDLTTGGQSVLASVNYDYTHGPGWSVQPGPSGGDFQPWLAPVGADQIPTLPVVTDVAAVVFLESLEAYVYANGWDYHQPLLSNIEVDPFDGSLVLGVMDRWAMMTGVFNCDLDPTTEGCGFSFPAPPIANYDGIAGDDAVARYTAGIIGYVAGDVLRMCNTAGPGSQPRFVLEGGVGCDPSGFSPAFEVPFGGGPAGTSEWYWNDQAFVDLQTENAHPEAAQGGLFIGDRSHDVVYTAMNPTETFGAGLSRDSNRDGSHQNGLQIFRSDLERRDGTTFKSAGLGDVEGCAIPLEIGNHVWFDKNVNGKRDPDERPIAGITVDLINDSNAVVATTISDRNGNYFFGTVDGLLPNTAYEVEFSTSELTETDDFGISRGELRETVNDVGVAEDRDSDVINNRIVFTTGDPGHNDHTLDAGFGPASELPDRVGLDSRDAPDIELPPGANPALSRNDPAEDRHVLRTVGIVLASLLLMIVILFFTLRWSWNRE
jgi:hypothetical protein